MEPAPIGMAVAVARRLWAGTVPSWCTGHLRGVRAEKGGARQRKGAFSSSASHWAILKQPIRGGQAICEKVSVTCEPGCRPQERRAEPFVPCHVRGAGVPGRGPRALSRAGAFSSQFVPERKGSRSGLFVWGSIWGCL